MRTKPSSLLSEADGDEGGGARTTTACARIDAFSANSVWLYWRPCIAESFIRGHGGNVDEEVALAIQNGKTTTASPELQRRTARLQLIFNAGAGRRPASTWLSPHQIRLAISRLSARRYSDGFSTCGPMVPPIKQEVKRSLSTTALRAIGLPGTIFNRRAARLPATRLIRSNGE